MNRRVFVVLGVLALAIVGCGKKTSKVAEIQYATVEKKTIEVTVDPRLLATYEAAGNNWHIRAGDYRLMLGQASDGQMQSVDVELPDSVWSASVTKD